MLNVAKVQYKLRLAYGVNFTLVWKYGVEYGRKFQYGIEYGMKDFKNGLEENCQCGIWKNRLPFRFIQSPAHQEPNIKSLSTLDSSRLDFDKSNLRRG